MKDKKEKKVKKESKRRQVDFINGSIGKLMIRLSIPAFMAIIMNLLYGFVDGIFIGKGIGQEALGGVSVVFPLTIIIISFASLIGEGLASVVARGGITSKDTTIMSSIKTAMVPHYGYQLS